jgi:hypothetical protein
MKNKEMLNLMEKLEEKHIFNYYKNTTNSLIVKSKNTCIEFETNSNMIFITIKGVCSSVFFKDYEVKLISKTLLISNENTDCVINISL